MRVAIRETGGDLAIPQVAWTLDRSYQWNYDHAPATPRVRRLPPALGGRLFDHTLNSPLGIAAGPLLNSKWVEAYARIGYDILTYATVRSAYRPAWSLPNIRCVESQEPSPIVTRRVRPGLCPTLAVSLGEPSTEPDVWRRDVRRAKERIGPGQMLIVSVMGTPEPGGDAEALIADYARCAAWASESGADAVELHLATPDPFTEKPQMIYENIPLAAQILYRVRTAVTLPVHERGNPAFEGSAREYANVVGAEIFPIASRQVEELVAWRRAGAWDRAILAVGGISTVERARYLLREGVDAALVATAALFDPLLAVRFRQIGATAVA